MGEKGPGRKASRGLADRRKFAASRPAIMADGAPKPQELSPKNALFAIPAPFPSAWAAARTPVRTPVRAPGEKVGFGFSQKPARPPRLDHLAILTYRPIIQAGAPISRSVTTVDLCAGQRGGSLGRPGHPHIEGIGLRRRGGNDAW